MNQKEAEALGELKALLEEIKRQADVGFLEAEEEIIEYYCLGYKTACEHILDYIKERFEV